MLPKKNKKVKNNEPEEVQKKVVGITEVEKVFLEQQLADSNKKVAKLKLTVEEYERKIYELQKAYNKLDVDRADIIAYLKKVLNTKNEENLELKENVSVLQETRDLDTTKFKMTVAQLEKNFSTMKDQLTAENKLLAGRINMLEEFKAIKDDLMKRFEDQEHAFKDLEMKHKRTIYDADKKFVIAKDKLKKEMEARLIKLAQDFQNESQLRIAASTHRVIRENIAVNNEIDNILTSQSKLTKQNELFRDKEKAARIEKELAEEERDIAIEKNIVLTKIINKLKTVHDKVLKDKALFKKQSFDFASLEEILHKITKENENLSFKVRVLEQNLHAKICDQNKSTGAVTKAIAESERLKGVIREAAIVVQATLNIDRVKTTDARAATHDKQPLLSKLLKILNQCHDIQKGDSIETIASYSKIYEKGDLGFIPKVYVATKMTTFQKDMKLESSKDTIAGSTSESSESNETQESLKTIPSLGLLPPLNPDREESLISGSKSVQSEALNSASFTIEKEHSDSDDDDTDKNIDPSLKAMQKSLIKESEFNNDTEPAEQIDQENEENIGHSQDLEDGVKKEEDLNNFEEKDILLTDEINKLSNKIDQSEDKLSYEQHEFSDENKTHESKTNAELEDVPQEKTQI